MGALRGSGAKPRPHSPRGRNELRKTACRGRRMSLPPGGFGKAGLFRKSFPDPFRRETVPADVAADDAAGVLRQTDRPGGPQAFFVIAAAELLPRRPQVVREPLPGPVEFGGR